MQLSKPSDAARRGAAVVSDITRRERDIAGGVVRVVLMGALVLSVLVLVVLIVDVVTGGWSVLSSSLGDLLTGTLSQAIRGSFYIAVFVIIVAVPLGVAAAIYLEEYASKGRFARFIDINIRNLAGVPSVVYGIFGLTIFVKMLGSITGPNSNGRSVISAGLTLSVLVLPIIIITSAEAIRAVPNGIREAGFGVGATRWEVVRSHVLPYAAPGILTGVVLSVARALGEAAPLILVGATTGFLTTGESYLPSSLQERFTALPIVISTWSGRPGEDWRSSTSAAIVVMLVIVLVANAGAILLRNHYEKKR